MRELHRVAVKIVVSGSALSVAALVLAGLAVRSPVVWPLFPEWVFEFLASALQPHTQEAVADSEFLGFWLVCLVALTLVAGAILVLVPRRSSVQPKVHA